MTGKDNGPGKLTGGFSDEQRRLLEHTLKEVEQRVVWEALKSLKIYLGVATLGTLVLLGVLGFLTFGGIRSSIVSAAADSLAGSTEINNEVAKKASEMHGRSARLIERSKELATSLEEAEAHIAAFSVTRLDEIHDMIKQIKEDLESLETKEEGQEPARDGLRRK